ncbi:uncharacterized protein LOC121378129 [Gigantopelta aegis]|uniref:uncharacterized protein LOC121378129 n=1 Tax=Gigantopelta aegis TaxID=1735272 RepID=UPI001B88AB38|nr:uncharacterized protein LOC121378129 [Gigantopelta aegis]
MMTSCCAIFGLVFLVITNLAIIIAFATPYWLELRSPYSFTGGENRGLWAYCSDEACTWVFQDHSIWRQRESGWWIATQALMSVGLALGLMSLLFATLALCCECRGCNCSHAIAGLLMIAFLVLGTSVVVFGINAHSDSSFKAEINWTKHARARFSWSFWLGVGSSGLAFLTSLIYACEGRQSRRH